MLQGVNPLAPNVRYTCHVMQCDAQNDKRLVKVRHLMAFLIQMSFKFQSSAAPAGHFIPAPKGQLVIATPW